MDAAESSRRHRDTGAVRAHGRAAGGRDARDRAGGRQRIAAARCDALVVASDRAAARRRSSLSRSARSRRVERLEFAEFVARRVDGEPVAYIVGSREFFSLPLLVSRDVLIPRPETELLVEAALARCSPLAAPAVLDVGTGSGAIALAIKHSRRDVRMTALDVSPEALEQARVNEAPRHGDARARRSAGSSRAGSKRFRPEAST